MTIRFYIVPLEVFINSVDPYSATRSRKYFGAINDDSNLLRVPIIPNAIRQSAHLGLENVCLVMADVTGPQHTLLTGYSDVITFPENLNNNPTQTAIDNVTPKLEAYKIPAEWINTSLTYKQVLKRIYRIFKVNTLFLEPHSALNLFALARNLSTQYSDLPIDIKNRLQSIAGLLNADISGLTNSSTIRQILKVLMDAQSGDWDGRL